MSCVFVRRVGEFFGRVSGIKQDGNSGGLGNLCQRTRSVTRTSSSLPSLITFERKSMVYLTLK